MVQGDGRVMTNPKALRSFSRCVAYCTASSYNLLNLMSYFKKRGYFTRLSRDVLHVTNLKRQGDLFFFQYGCFVAWGFKRYFLEKLLDVLDGYSVRSASIESDQFYYHYGESTTIDTHERLHVDIITLDSEDPMVKLAISYGLSQAIKLESFEESIKETIKKNNALPEEIVQKGTISLSRRSIVKRIGEIFIVRSSINLNIEYLDVPEFFWRNPSLEPYYITIKKFLDIQSRVSALNQKLDVLQELLDILNSQVQNSHSNMLESIVIILIAVEIVIMLFQFHVV